MRVSIIDALFVTADRKRSRRHNNNNDSIDTSLQLLKAVEQEIKTYEHIVQTPTSRRRRSNSDLREIMKEFQNTRDAIKTNYDWKHFDFDGFNDTTWNTTTPDYDDNYNNNTVCPPPNTPNDCKSEILLTASLFGAFIFAAYVMLKIFNYLKKNHK